MQDPPLYAFIPVALFFVGAIVVPIALLLVARALSHRVYGKAKSDAYECGVDPIGDATERFSVRFYLVAMLFLIFDVETVFLLPWAILFDQLALVGFIEMVTFIAILIVGYAYAWRRGALAWV